MAETAVPFDAGAYMYQAEWSTLWSATLSDGVLNRNAPSIGGYSQNLTVYTDNDGRQVKITPGNAHIHGKLYTNTAVNPVPVTANTSGVIRYDNVVIRLNEPERLCAGMVIPGTPGSGGPPPLLTGVGGEYDVLLKVVTVDPGANSFVSTKLSGGRIWAAPKGTEAWVDYNPIPYAITGNVPGLQVDPVDRARYQLVGQTCKVSYQWKTALSSTSCPEYAVSLPLPARFSGVTGTCGIQNFVGKATIYPNSLVGVSDARNQIVGLKKYDGSNLPSDSIGRTDSFDIQYEVDLSV